MLSCKFKCKCAPVAIYIYIYESVHDLKVFNDGYFPANVSKTIVNYKFHFLCARDKKQPEKLIAITKQFAFK